MAAIDLSGVTKRFADVVAVSDLDLVVEDGEIFGFLGPNGAGKTTTIDLMLDFVRPTQGRVELLGQNVAEDPVPIRRRTGVLPEGFEVYARLTGRQHLEFAIESKGADDEPIDLLERVGIPEAADRKAGGYSKGMAQRLMLGMALVGAPDLLILDEPSTGLDPNGAREMRALVREENDRGTTIFFSSHILEQVEAVCDRVGIILDGEMVAVDTVDGLRESIAVGTTLHITVDAIDEEALSAVRGVEGVTNVRATANDGTHQVIVQTEGSKTAVLGAFEDEGVDVIDFRTEQASLDDVFHAYTTDTMAVDR